MSYHTPTYTNSQATQYPPGFSEIIAAASKSYSEDEICRKVREICSRTSRAQDEKQEFNYDTNDDERFRPEMTLAGPTSRFSQASTLTTNSANTTTSARAKFSRILQGVKALAPPAPSVGHLQATWLENGEDQRPGPWTPADSQAASPLQPPRGRTDGEVCKFSCLHCPLTFTRSNDLSRHTDNTCKGLKLICCLDCRYSKREGNKRIDNCRAWGHNIVEHDQLPEKTLWASPFSGEVFVSHKEYMKDYKKNKPPTHPANYDLQFKALLYQPKFQKAFQAEGFTIEHWWSGYWNETDAKRFSDKLQYGLQGSNASRAARHLGISDVAAFVQDINSAHNPMPEKNQPSNFMDLDDDLTTNEANPYLQHATNDPRTANAVLNATNDPTPNSNHTTSYPSNNQMLAVPQAPTSSQTSSVNQHFIKARGTTSHQRAANRARGPPIVGHFHQSYDPDIHNTELYDLDPDDPETQQMYFDWSHFGYEYNVPQYSRSHGTEIE